MYTVKYSGEHFYLRYDISQYMEPNRELGK